MIPRNSSQQVAPSFRVAALPAARRLDLPLAWPLVTASIGGGLLVIALADAASRLDLPYALALFWVGYLLIVGPATLRLVARPAGLARSRSVAPSVAERLAIVLTLGLALYLIKVMISPTAFIYPDEYSHLRTLADIQQSGHLFTDNPLLQVSPIYPGLETATATIIATTALDPVAAGLLLIGAARAVLVLALFLLARSITGSARAAGIACLIYMANPSFLLFDSAFSYESLALPLAVAAIWATHSMIVLRRLSAPLLLVSLGAATAVAVTHHVTSFVLLSFLSLWWLIALVRDRGRAYGTPLLLTVAWAWLSNILWHVIAGPAVASYLLPVLSRGFAALLRVLVGDADPKPLFAPIGGVAPPLPEVVIAYAAVGLLVLSLPFVLYHNVMLRRPSAIVLTLAAGAALYPASLALRLTALGSETSQRASEFVFLGLAILGAAWLTSMPVSEAASRSVAARNVRRGTGRLGTFVGSLLRPRWLTALTTRARPTRSAVVAALLVVILAGGIASGAAPPGRLPGPYRVAAESRSFEAQGISAAEWALRWLGPGHRMIADRTNAKLMASVGLQYPVTSANSGLGTAWVMFAARLGEAQLDVLREGRIEFIVVDLRLSTAPPQYAYYFEAAEPEGGRHTSPMPRYALEKFDNDPRITRVYDSGDIVIYDVRRLVDALG